MRRPRQYAPALLILGLVGVTADRAHGDGVLPIRPVLQAKPVWCWLAVGEMVFQYLGVPNANPYGYYQCGIIGILGGPGRPCWNDCTKCDDTAGSFFRGLNWKQTMLHMFATYPVEAERFTGRRSPRVTVSLSEMPLTPAALATEIDQRRPVIAGISPIVAQRTGTTQHVALIVGYRRASGRLMLTVNDSYPYQSLVGSDPYKNAGGRHIDRNGQYEIEYDAFRRELIWVESFHHFRAQ